MIRKRRSFLKAAGGAALATLLTAWLTAMWLRDKRHLRDCVRPGSTQASENAPPDFRER